MDLTDLPDHEIREYLYNLLGFVEELGGWSRYATFVGGEADTGFPELDAAIAELYYVNELLHNNANALFIKYGVKF